jgi:hypothetical protein
MKHLLQEHKILKTFSVRKFINQEDIKEKYKNVFDLCKNETEVNETLISILKKESSTDEIPGSVELTSEEQRICYLNFHIDSLCNHFKKSKFNDDEIAFVLSGIIKKYEITIDNIRKFLKK